MRVRVALPHFFRETEGGSGYGSGRKGARLERGLALGRTLAALLELQRAERDLVLNIGGRHLDDTGPAAAGDGAALPAIELELHLFTSGGHALEEVIAVFAGELTRHRLALEDPRQLPLAARDFLIAAEPGADLVLYLEDDLVIADPLFLDKQRWFLERAGGRAVLMPHRTERLPGRAGQRLLVDGPLREEFIGRFTRPRPAEARGRFRGAEVVFDRTANPHAGLFCLNRAQVERLRPETLPREGFIGPLETAATLTVLRYFPVYKPSWPHRRFLAVEHGHPSFRGYAERWQLS